MSDGDVAAGGSSRGDSVFTPIGADADSPKDALTVVDSLCMNCHQDGTTRLLLTNIPFYRDVLVSSFCCPHCYYSDTLIQGCGPVQNRGVKYKLNVASKDHLDRQVIKGDYATISVPAIELVIPPESQKGVISTVEGVLQRVVDGLLQHQSQRLQLQPQMAHKVQSCIDNITHMISHAGFLLTLDDPSGNSFIQNPNAPLNDADLQLTHYVRTLEQDEQCGISQSQQHDAVDSQHLPPPAEQHEAPHADSNLNLVDEVCCFRTNCCCCNAVCETRMKPVKIPLFKEVIIMATTCDSCGFKSDEVKSGSGIEPTGVKYTLDVKTWQDMNRDVLKSETCGLSMPELELELEHGSLGGKFTTIEGLVSDVLQGVDRLDPFLLAGDSRDEQQVGRLAAFKGRLNECAELSRGFTLVLDDPAGNSFISHVADAEHDHALTVQRYSRSFEQNDMLGLNDLNTDNYTN